MGEYNTPASFFSLPVACRLLECSRMWLVCAFWTCAQDGPAASTQERILRLEEDQRKRQEEIDRLRGSETQWSLSFGEGLRIRSPAEDLELHLGGRFIEHVRAIAGRPDDPRISPDSFYVRQALILLDGTLSRDFRFALRADMTSTLGGASASLPSTFLAWEPTPGFTLVFGQFRVPQSQEAVTATIFTDCVERSIVAAFVPSTELGIKAASEAWGGILGGQIALTNGRGHLSGDGRTRNDDNDEKELTLRLTTTRWVDAEDSPLHRLFLAFYGSLSDVDDVPMATGFDLETTELGVTFLDASAGTLDGRRRRAGSEISWSLGPFGLRGDFLVRTDEAVNGAVREEIPIRAWEATATLLLTGEEKSMGDRVIPLHPFDPVQGGWGAVELAFRIGGARVGREIEKLGTSLAGQSNEVRTFTAGINWFPAANVRLSSNAVLEEYGDGIDFAGGREDRLIGFLARFQLDF